MDYRREVDGLRALAVIPVMLFHGGFQTFSGGYVGVDVFFVISGYLITSIIIAKMHSGSFTLIGFYENRARRILPALLFVMLVSLPFAWFLMVPVELRDFSQSLVAVPLFVSNITFYLESGYFGNAAELKPLLHTWSLAVEEQYYFLFPIFILLTWRFGSRWIVGILIVVAFVSLYFAQKYSLRLPQAAFYLLPMRGWEILIGVFIAFYQNKKKINSNKTTENSTAYEFLSIIGFVFIVYSIVAFDENTPFPSLYALIPTLGAALIILFATPRTFIGNFLGSRVLVGIGLISYSAYLWHQPLLAFARLYASEEPGTFQILLLILISFPLAYLSWKFVERPFRGPDSVSPRVLLTYSIGASAIFISVGLWGQMSNGYEDIYFEYRLDNAEKEMFKIIKKHTSGNLYLDMGDDGDCNFWAKNIDSKFVERFKKCSEKYGKAMVVLGDSHAMNIYNALYRVNQSKFLVGISQGGCRPHQNLELCQYDNFEVFLANNSRDVKVVVFHQAGLTLLRDKEKAVVTEGLKSTEFNVDLNSENARKISDYLNILSRFSDVVWLGPFVETGYDFRNVRRVIEKGLKINQEAINTFKGLDSELKKYFTLNKEKFNYVSLIDIIETTPEFLRVGDCLTYRDEDHFSVCGEKIIGEKIKAAFRGIVNPVQDPRLRLETGYGVRRQ